VSESPKERRFTMKKVIFLMVLLSFFGCSMMDKKVDNNRVVEHKVTIDIRSKDSKNAVVEVKEGDKVVKSMEVRKEGYELSQLSARYGNKLYIKLFSGLSVADVTRAWTDMIIAVDEFGFGEGSEVHLFIDSPGGDAFSGLALADLIEKYQKKGIKFIAHGTGIIASAAVPIFAVCDETHATKATIFMVHEAALWKWPGRETASDIRSQTSLMDLLQRLYMEKLVNNSCLSYDKWILLEAKTSWFDTTTAKDMCILDYIDN
jgi:ATP-dependent protease ClpP protease subunit